MTDKKDALGNRMKKYEKPSTDRIAFKGQPLIVRLDGKSFHTFTKGLVRPYDVRLTNLMIQTMNELINRFGANVGYTQSDEITLVWLSEPELPSELPFGGRFQKFESVLAGFASAYFTKHLPQTIPSHKDNVVVFDCRAFVVPNVQEAYHAVLWRQNDCTKNAISMAAHALFSHKELQGVSGPQMQEMMFSRCGVNFNDFPPFFKRGTFGKRVTEERLMTEDELNRIPPNHRPSEPVLRSYVKNFDIWLTKQSNPVATLFYGAAITPH